MPGKKISTVLIGTAGEHFVLYRLRLQGMIASLAPKKAPNLDVLVLSPEEKVRASLQVKARTRRRDGGWRFSQKHETVERPKLFYALVDFEPEAPQTHIVPSRVVAEVLSRAHQAWLVLPGRGGRPHKDTPQRRLLPAYTFDVPGFPPGWLDQYRENWEILDA